MRIATRVLLCSAAGLALLACGQKDVTLPEQGGAAAGECGAWYPGGGDAGVADTDDTDSDVDSTDYAYDIGSTLPCFVWESVRIGDTDAEEDTYVNMGEVYLQSKWGEIDEFREEWGEGIAAANWLLLVLVATDCPSCANYVGNIMDHRPDFEGRGVAIVGVARSQDLDNTIDLSLEEASEVLLEKGMAADIHRTNDEEKYLGANAMIPSGYPQVGLVRLSDMQVVHKTLDPYDDPALLGAQAVLDIIDANTH